MFKTRSLILLAATLLAACGSEPSYRLGVWAGPTGANLAKMLESDVNLQGGIGDRRLVTRVVSQRTVSFGELTPDVLRLSLDSMAADTMLRGVVMRMTDSVTEAAARRFEAEGVPYLITNPVQAAFLDSHPHAFSLVPTIEEQAEFLAEQVAAEPEPRRVVLFSLREPHADSLAATLSRVLTGRGIPPVFHMTFPQSADNYQMQAKAAETNTHKPTVILFVGRTPSLFEVYGTFLNAQRTVRVLASDLVDTFHLYGNPGQRYTGVRFVRFFDPLAQDSVTIRLRDRLSGWIGRNELNSEAAVTYDAIVGLVSLMKNGAVSRDSLYQALRSGASMTGLHGEWRFDQDRRVRRPIQLVEVRAEGVTMVASNQRIARREN